MAGSGNFEWVTFDLTDAEIEAACLGIGRIAVAHTLLDIQVGKLLTVVAGGEPSKFAEHLVHSVEAGRKKQMLDALSTVFQADPFGLQPDYQPHPELRGRIKAVSSRYEDTTRRRNTACHGTLGKYKGRVIVASVAAERLFKNDASMASWVYIDDVQQIVDIAYAAAGDAKQLRLDYLAARECQVRQERPL